MSERPLRPPRRRRSHSRGPDGRPDHPEPVEPMTGFPNRLRRNLSTDLALNNDLFPTASVARVNQSNLEINRALSSHAFAPLHPLFGPHAPLASTWRSLKPEPPPKRPEVAAKPRPEVSSFEEHFRQYSATGHVVEEPKKDFEPKKRLGRPRTPPLVVARERKASLPADETLAGELWSRETVAKMSEKARAGESVVLVRGGSRGRGRGPVLGEWALVAGVVALNTCLVFSVYYLMS